MVNETGLFKAIVLLWTLKRSQLRFEISTVLSCNLQLKNESSSLKRCFILDPKSFAGKSCDFILILVQLPASNRTGRGE